MILLITYDLKQPGQRYDSLYGEIKKARKWWHYLESTWIIDTESEPEHWTDRLLKHLDSNDSLLVIEVCENYQGWLPERAWKWLGNKTYRC